MRLEGGSDLPGGACDGKVVVLAKEAQKSDEYVEDRAAGGLDSLPSGDVLCV